MRLVREVCLSATEGLCSCLVNKKMDSRRTCLSQIKVLPEVSSNRLEAKPDPCMLGKFPEVDLSDSFVLEFSDVCTKKEPLSPSVMKSEAPDTEDIKLEGDPNVTISEEYFEYSDPAIGSTQSGKIVHHEDDLVSESCAVDPCGTVSDEAEERTSKERGTASPNGVRCQSPENDVPCTGVKMTSSDRQKVGIFRNFLSVSALESSLGSQETGLSGKTRTEQVSHGFPVYDRCCADESSLDRQVRSNVAEKLYMCTVCTKPFSDVRSFLGHLRVSKEDRPYSCPTCRRSFNYAAVLHNHTRIHTGEKPYTCSVCNRTFRQLSSLNTHVRIHTGEKPYTCQLCKKDFRQVSGLHAHMKNHTGGKTYRAGKPYRCAACRKAFVQLSAFNFHMEFHAVKEPFTRTLS